MVMFQLNSSSNRAIFLTVSRYYMSFIVLIRVTILVICCKIVDSVTRGVWLNECLV